MFLRKILIVIIGICLFYNLEAQIITNRPAVFHTITTMDGTIIPALKIFKAESYVEYELFNGEKQKLDLTEIYSIDYLDNPDEIIGNRDTYLTNKENMVFSDQRDGQEYRYVKILNQTWMAENLNFETDDSKEYTKVSGCGRHYKYEEAMNVCPSGWHLPSDEEWINLEMNLGMQRAEAEKKEWRGTSPGHAHHLFNGGITGLGIEICGAFNNRKRALHMIKNTGFYWTSTSIRDNAALTRQFWSSRKSIFRFGYSKSHRLNVRCIKDESSL